MKLEEFIEMMRAAGWRENGLQEHGAYRTASPGFNGSIVKTGGRQRWIGPGNRRATVGARTVCFFELVDGSPADFRNYSVKWELEAAAGELDKKT